MISKDMLTQLDRDNAKQPVHLRLVPPEDWPEDLRSGTNLSRAAVYRSRRFLVQVFIEQTGITRLSINRTKVKPDGSWDDGITWDEIQTIKRELGMGDKYAVEVYPRDRDMVNVANMRHVWVLAKPLWNIGWFKDSDELTY